MDLDKLYQAYLSSTGVCTDTRKIEKGCIFFALKGDNFNGNRFAEQALSNGAMLAVVDEEEFAGQNCLLVDDGLTALQELSKHHRNQLSLTINRSAALLTC